MVNEEVCLGCGICINECPVDAIKFDENGKAKINQEKCVKCGTCQMICPVSAIDIG